MPEGTNVKLSQIVDAVRDGVVEGLQDPITQMVQKAAEQAAEQAAATREAGEQAAAKAAADVAAKNAATLAAADTAVPQGAEKAAAVAAPAAPTRQTKAATDYGRLVNSAPKSVARGGDQPGLAFSRVVRALAHAKGNPDGAIAFANHAWDADTAATVTKTLTAGDFEGGGFLVPSEVSQDIIGLLRARAALRRAGPVIVEMNGSLDLPKLTQGATASWKGEAKTKNAAKLKGGQVKLVAHELETKVLISERLQRESPTSADALVRRDMIAAMRNAEDRAFLTGVGSENQPKGLTGWAVTGNKFAADAANSLASIRADLRKMIDKLTSNNLPLERPAFFMSHRTRNFLAWDMTDADGRLVFQEQLSRTEAGSDGFLNGIPVFATNNIADNLGAGSDESLVVLAEMSDIVIGQGPNLRVKVSNEASVTDETGTLVSAFERGLTVIMIESELDLVSRHAESIAVLQAVAWTS